MSAIIIRDRTDEDLPHCVEVLADVHRVDGYPMLWPADPQRWLTPRNLRHAWVATTDDGAVVGHVVVQNVVGQAGFAQLGRLFVTPAVRRDQVGTRLVRHVREWAADRETGLLLEVVASERSAAVALYERTGWAHTRTDTAEWTTPDGGPVLLRHYTLANPNG